MVNPVYKIIEAPFTKFVHSGVPKPGLHPLAVLKSSEDVQQTA